MNFLHPRSLMAFKIKLVFFVVFSIIFPTLTYADVTIYNNVKDLSVLDGQIKLDKVKNDETLVIFDIDDTLLESANFVGSGKWYHWQRGRKVYDNQNNSFTINKNQKFHCIFRTLGTLFEIGTTKLTQKNAVDILNRQKKYDLLLLTARTAKYRSATERELKKHRIDLSKEHFKEAINNFDYQFNDGNRTAQVTYKNGFVMTSGLNKGLVLESILKKSNRQYKNIYFIDDSLKNIENMKKVWDKKPTKMNIFHYTKVNKSISREEINESDKAKKYFDQFLSSAYPEQLEKFKEKQCN